MANVAGAFIANWQWVWRTAWKRRWLALGAAVLVGAAGAVLISMLPNRFRASARVFVETQTVLKPLMAGLAFQPDVDEQVRMLARTLISRPNVERLLNVPQLGLNVTQAADREDTVNQLMKRIQMESAGAGNLNLYEISYDGTSPEHARRLVEATVDLFVNAGSGAKRRDSQEAGRFIEDQIRMYEAKLVEAESRLKDFKLHNFGLTGVSSQDHFARISALSDEVSKLRMQLSAAERTRDAYRRELATQDPRLPLEAGARTSTPAVAEVEARLEAQLKQLDDLRRRFTEQHPDVISTRRAIAELEVQLQRRRDESERAFAHTGTAAKAATSPVYQRIRVSLADTEAQVASLQAQLANQQSLLDEARAMAGRVPQVEAELAQLNRDYDVIRKNYEQMVGRRESASLGAKLDESSQLVEFRLVDPPRVSRKPVFPSRLHLALMTVVAALALGIAAALAIDIVRPTFDDAATLEELSGRPVVSNVSALMTPLTQAVMRSDAMRFAAVATVLLLAQGAWLAWIASKSIG